MENNVESLRTHRVGSMTAGVSMIIFGILFLLHTVFRLVEFEMIFAFWPVILIGLGIELLLSNLGSKKIVYDKGAIVILFLMVLFAMGMAITEVCIETSQMYYQTQLA